MITDVFSKTKLSDFEELCNTAKQINSNINVELLVKEMKEHNKCLDELQSRWEKSLETNTPDYSVYGEDIYLNEGFRCWKMYSRRYLQLLQKFNEKTGEFKNVKSIVDLGCGIAYTTVGLKTIFPDADVYGTNIKDTLQWEIDKIVCKDSGCTIVDGNLNGPYNIDMLVAFEFFEHIVIPIGLLNDLLDKYKPKYIVFANTFTQMSIGHFNTYYYGGVAYTGREISRMFSKVLRSRGYSKVETGFFNNRPSVYKLTTRKNRLF